MKNGWEAVTTKAVEYGQLESGQLATFLKMSADGVSFVDAPQENLFDGNKRQYPEAGHGSQIIGEDRGLKQKFIRIDWGVYVVCSIRHRES